MVITLWEQFQDFHSKLEMYDKISPRLSDNMLKMNTKIMRNAVELCKKSVFCSNEYMTRSYYCAIIAVLGNTLHDRSISIWVHKQFLAILKDILPNGCFRECWLYDSMDKQVECLLSTYNIMIALSSNGFDYYTYKNRYGGSICKAVHLLIPYVRQGRIHIQNLYPIRIDDNNTSCCVWNYRKSCTIFRIFASYDKKVCDIYYQFFAIKK